MKNLDDTKAFFGALGYPFNPQFTDETTRCMVISDDIYAMLLTEAKFKQFTPKTVLQSSDGIKVQAGRQPSKPTADLGRPRVALKPYGKADLPLLERNNSSEMTEHLGGPESAEQIRQRHQRYLETPQTGKGHMFTIVLQPGAERTRVIGYWEKTWLGELVWEAGWGVLPEYQGRGIAKAALAALVEKARLAKKHRFLHAFPSVHNPPSNAICRAIRFELIGECDFEYPPGHMMRCNDWRRDLLDEN